MPTCDVCGNEYDKAFQVTQAGRTMTFDSFECAIHAMAPTCAHCNCKIVGHGVEAGGAMYCYAHCADHEGGTKDHSLCAAEGVEAEGISFIRVDARRTCACGS